MDQRPARRVLRDLFMSDVINFEEIDEFGSQTVHGLFEIPPGELDRDEVSGPGSIELDARVEPGNFPGEYIAEGTAKAVLDLNCSRCLDPYPFAHSGKFHVRFRPRPVGSVGDEEVQIGSEEELDVEYYTDRTIPLRDLATEQIQLTVPMKPLCDEKCLGLCPKCGVNRTRERCNCDDSVTDERWGALQGIRDQISKKTNQ